MTKITFVSHSGNAVDVDAEDGDSIMRAALDNGIDGIEAECGGSLMCATCHVYIDPADAARVGDPSAEEQEMLEGAESELRNTSRLSCQVTVSPALEGVTIHLPEAQT